MVLLDDRRFLGRGRSAFLPDWPAPEQLFVSAAEEVEPTDVRGDLLERLPNARYRIDSHSSRCLAGGIHVPCVVVIVGGRLACAGYDIQAGSPRRYLPKSSSNVGRPRLLGEKEGTPEERRRREDAEQDLARFLLDEAEELPALIREASRAGVAADSTILTRRISTAVDAWVRHAVEAAPA